MLTDDQLKMRLTGVGASEAGAVVGVDPFRSALDVWMLKTGLSTVEPNKYMEWGHRLESVVLDKYADETGAQVDRTNETLRHPDMPHILATLDGRTDDCLVEVKTTSRSEGWGDAFTDDVPDSVLLQCVQQMAVTDVDRVDVAMLNLSRRDFRIYHIRRDLELESMLLDKVSSFWVANVVANVAPEVTPALVLARNPKDNGIMIEATVDQMWSMKELARINAKIKALGKDADQLKGLLKVAIGENSGISTPHGSTATWKSRTGSKFVAWEAVASILAVKLGIDRFEFDELTTRHTETRKGTRAFRLCHKNEEQE
jgi:putative phage-type endonuclease